jgi:predicted RNase H-like HicB family nuclease
VPRDPRLRQPGARRTEDEAIANIREAIVGCLEVRAEEGMPLTVRTVEVDVAVA